MFANCKQIDNNKLITIIIHDCEKYSLWHSQRSPSISRLDMIDYGSWCPSASVGPPCLAITLAPLQTAIFGSRFWHSGGISSSAKTLLSWDSKALDTLDFVNRRSIYFQLKKTRIESSCVSLKCIEPSFQLRISVFAATEMSETWAEKCNGLWPTSMYVNLAGPLQISQVHPNIGQYH